MKKLLPVIAALCMAGNVAASELKSAVDADYAYILNLYKHFHQYPELSFKESKSAERMKAELEPLGFEVTTGVGDKWAKQKARTAEGELIDGVGGYGLVAVMENGDGPTVMLRADMDALPLQEKTGLDYASKVTDIDYRGVEAPVMHACAHDSHMAILIGVARQLAAMKDQWTGTLVLIGQPAEELGLGAIAMLDDDLYEDYPKPDYVLATHTSGWDPAGKVAYTSGYALANVDSVDIIIKGVGAHGSAPQFSKDPIVIGAQIINALQTLVSRELDPLQAGVVTVGAFNAGYKHNIIPDRAHLQLTVRSYEDGVRQKLLDGIKRIAIAQAKSAGLTDDMMPEVTVEEPFTPSTYNDPEMTARVMAAIGKAVGEDRVYQRPPSMGGEDFSRFGRTDDDIPTLIYWTGGNDPEAMQAAREGKAPPPPANHSPFFAPIAEPTLKIGVSAMTAGALELLGSR